MNKLPASGQNDEENSFNSIHQKYVQSLTCPGEEWKNPNADLQMLTFRCIFFFGGGGGCKIDTRSAAEESEETKSYVFEGIT